MHRNSSRHPRPTRATENPRPKDEGTPIASSSNVIGSDNTHSVVSRDPAHRRAPSRAEVLLQEYTLRQMQNKKAAESARTKDPLQNLAEISKRLGANSGMIRGPARASLTGQNSTSSSVPIAPHTSMVVNIPATGANSRNTTSNNPVTLVAKTVTSPILPWKDQDSLRQSRVRAQKRSRDAGGLGDDDEPVRRLARMRIANIRSNVADPPRDDIPAERPPKSYLSPRLVLKQEGHMDSSSSSDAAMEVDNPLVQAPSTRQAGRKRIAFKKVASSSAASGVLRMTKTPLMIVNKEPSGMTGIHRKSARKLEKTLFTDSDSGEETDESHSTSSKASEELEIKDEGSPLIKVEEEDEGARQFGPAELVILDSPPRITIPLPQLGPKYNHDSSTTFPPLIISALESLTLSSARLHQTRQLPFLLRTLRRGFLFRCQSLGVSLKEEVQNTFLRVRYDHVDDVHLEITLHEWRCPLCSLHSAFQNQRLLEKHLAWDHAEFFVEWQLYRNNSWALKILVPEAASSGHQNEPATLERVVKQEATSSPPHPLLISPANRRDTLFSFVTLSPPSSPESPPPLPEISSLPPVSPTPEGTSASPTPALSSTRSSVAKGKRPMYPPSLPSTSSRSRAQSSTIASSVTARTSTTVFRMPASRFVGPDGKQYPAPPPPENPLGPAAQGPYLPAEPDYPNGHMVYYSCRPGGPTVYDLLNTLSMEPFGVLAWAVLEREEEIFESDENFKDEQKVMHALWARWILLNRRKFIADFHKGVQAFVDEYWRMIHRAAGWEALRYWLILLLANRFLTAKEVAITLKHYEGLTGMDYWYD